MDNTANKKFITICFVFVIALAFVGFADSTFLLAKRMSGGPIPCVLGFTGCDEVSKSPYSALFGIPLSVYGMIFYLAIGAFGILYLDTKRYIFARLLLLATTLGFLMSLYFIYVQKFLIGAFCIYCILSAIISTVLFGFGITIYKILKP
ncbi:MAG: vitamin K epoxide reductase family protein [Candidatus Yonathbacteria bacterium]|nr:vitamin K epoxide reductase family protein [Candidatus Yonathbacteria bacterium]